MSHDFPGNVRELENIIEYATVVCKNGVIGVDHLPDYFRNSEEGRVKGSPEDKPSSLGEVERGYILETLKRNQWNRSVTAAEMGIHATTLWRKMKRVGIKAPEKTRPQNCGAGPQPRPGNPLVRKQDSPWQRA